MGRLRHADGERERLEAREGEGARPAGPGARRQVRVPSRPEGRHRPDCTARGHALHRARHHPGPDHQPPCDSVADDRGPRPRADRREGRLPRRTVHRRHALLRRKGGRHAEGPRGERLPVERKGDPVRRPHGPHDPGGDLRRGDLLPEAAPHGLGQVARPLPRAGSDSHAAAHRRAVPPRRSAVRRDGAGLPDRPRRRDGDQGPPPRRVRRDDPVRVRQPGLRALRDQRSEREPSLPRLRNHVEDLSRADLVRVQAPARRTFVLGGRHASTAGGHAMMFSRRGVTKRTKAIKSALLTPDETRRMSATKIITADTYDDDGFPIDMGLMDSHLGVIEPGLRCKTCGGKVDDCPGHFGHIDLAMPVIHVGYVKDIKKLLQATCRKCGRLLLTKQQAEEFRAEMEQMEELGGEQGIQYVTKETAREATERQRWPHCGEEQQKITLDKPTTFRENGHKLTPKEERERLQRIPNRGLHGLRVNPDVARPEGMILTALLLPPVTGRPAITLDSGDRSEDDLTHKLVDVLRINQRLRENRDAGAPQLIVEDLWELLQYHVTTYFDNQTSGIPPARHRSGRPLKTLVQR